MFNYLKAINYWFVSIHKINFSENLFVISQRVSKVFFSLKKYCNILT